MDIYVKMIKQNDLPAYLFFGPYVDPLKVFSDDNDIDFILRKREVISTYNALLRIVKCLKKDKASILSEKILIDSAVRNCVCVSWNQYGNNIGKIDEAQELGNGTPHIYNFITADTFFSGLEFTEELKGLGYRVSVKEETRDTAIVHIQECSKPAKFTLSELDVNQFVTTNMDVNNTIEKEQVREAAHYKQRALNAERKVQILKEKMQCLLMASDNDSESDELGDEEVEAVPPTSSLLIHLDTDIQSNLKQDPFGLDCWFSYHGTPKPALHISPFEKEQDGYRDDCELL
jgi:hypothetical protein